jgi:hypothetical protein
MFEQAGAVQMQIFPLLLSRTPTTDCLLFLLCVQHQSPRRDVLWIFQREKKSLQAIATIVIATRLPLQRREAAKDIPVCVQNGLRCVHMSLASPLKDSRAETFAGSSPQKLKPLPVELVKWRQKGSDNQRV